jgi:hypothetical protein
MHRIILERKLGRPLADGEKADHENRIGIDNRRCNLRPASNAENSRNQGIRNDNTSGFKGVHYHVQHGKWVAKISIGQSEQKHLGYFDTPEEAAAAYESAAEQIFGDFAPKSNLVWSWIEWFYKRKQA